MKHVFKTIVIILLVSSLFLTSCGTQKSQPTSSGKENKISPKIKVALLLPGTINDNGWNAKAYNGIKLVEKELGAEVAYTEKVAQSDQEEVFRNYAAQGYNVLIGHGFQFADAAKRVAKDNPDIKFLITSTNISQAPNLASTNTNPMQMGFLEGVVAGLVTKANNVGAVGGQEIPPIVSVMKGFKAGVKYINPNAKITITMTSDFEDAIKAKEAAKALIAQGSDIVMLDADQAGLGVIEACKEKGIYAISSVGAQHDLAPDIILGSGISDVPKAIEVVVKHVIDGDFNAQFYDLGVTEGAVYFVPNPKFESIYKENLNQVIEDIKNGKINVEELVNKN